MQTRRNFSQMFSRIFSLGLRPGHAAALGVLFGLAGLLCGLRPASADLSTVYQFTGTYTGPDGCYPNSLIQGKDGNFYGTTTVGGSKGDGTVFKLTPEGKETKLVNFNSNTGAYPIGSLLQAKDGSFYGTTNGGGGRGSSGTVYRLVTDGTAAGTTLTTLYRFPDDGSLGSGPTGLTQAKDGSFYGTTTYGGNNHNTGTIFRLTTDGTAAGTTLTTLFTFPPDGSLGAEPNALIQAQDGSFYGTTVFGSDSFGPGSVFRLVSDGTAAGTTLTTLYNFPTDFHRGGEVGGADPVAALLQAADGSFYGTTEGGGNSPTNDLGYGTIFRLTTDGTAAGTTLTSLYNFLGPNGASPLTPLLQAQDGSFYGLTSSGGSGTYNDGTVFHLTTDGTATGSTLTTLVNFHGPDGVIPTALLQANDGTFYGTTEFDGTVTEPISGYGLVFHLTSAPVVRDPIESLTLTPATVLGGNSVTGEVTLRNIATVPQTVTLASSAPSFLSVRASVTITPGHRHALFTAQTLPFYLPVTLTITATGDNGAGATKSAHVLVTPSPLLSVTATPASLVGGSVDAAGEVTLKDIARVGVTVWLTSSAPSVLSVRDGVIVTTGHRHALFTLVSHPVTTAQTVTITAVANGVTKTTTVTVTP